MWRWLLVYLLLTGNAVAGDIYKFNPHTGKLDNIGPPVNESLGYTPEDSANKGQANGYASLDGSGKVPSAQLPSGSSETQATLLDKLATSTDGAILVLTQGPTEANNAPRLQVKHRDGTITFQLNTDGTFCANQGGFMYGAAGTCP